jgi:uncharacterized protein
MDYAQVLAGQIQVRVQQTAAAIELLDAGNTIPFIARYRKEATGGLDEEQLRRVQAGLERLRLLDERRETILKTIQEQGQLTPELQGQIMDAETLTVLEDLYQPYKPKRRTRASVAREKGLQGLADWILQQPLTRTSLLEIARPFLNEAVADAEAAWAGARDIVAEAISDHAEVRRIAREKAMQWGTLKVERLEGSEDPRGVYQLYYDFDGRIDRLRPYQTLAINRGEAEKVLRVRLMVAERDWQTAVQAAFRANPRSPLAPQLEQAAADAADRLLLPAIERDVRRILTEKAELHAMSVFAANLRALLSQPPLAGHVVLGVDPGFRTGSKLAVVDPTGKLLEAGTIYPHEPQNRWGEALAELARLAARYGVTLITIGNGAASRETERLVAELIQRLEATPGLKAPRYLIVNEAGASVYSASPLARAELPELDVSLRGAVSIARRAQDPLAELVKIDPKSIGVGMYQHDVDQKQLARTLSGVVESVVNQVGVDVNTASPALLTYIAGIGPKLAERIVAYRDRNGPFADRAALQRVSGLGPKAYEQSAGFLRIRGGSEPLDSSAIHPESYSIAHAVLRRAAISMQSQAEDRREALAALLQNTPPEVLAGELGCGLPTLKDIIDQLLRPGRDPRLDLPAPILRSDVLSVEDLAPGMRLKGTVRNVVDFGAFVDIGVKQDGLLHRSQIPFGTVLQVGDVLEFEILKVELERGRISLGWPA